MKKKDQRVIYYSEVAKHNKKDDCWIIINDQVYDLTEQKQYHPVGQTPINLFAGKDATWLFNLIPFHKQQVKEILSRFKVGNLVIQKDQYIPNNKVQAIIASVIIASLFLYFFLFI